MRHGLGYEIVDCKHANEMCVTPCSLYTQLIIIVMVQRDNHIHRCQIGTFLITLYIL